MPINLQTTISLLESFSRQDRSSLDVAEKSGLDEVIESFPQLSREDKAVVFGAINPKISFLLFSYADDQAVQAVRQRSLNALRRGLMAVVVENCSFDWRDSIVRLALLYRSCALIEGNQANEFGWAASFATERTSVRLIQFVQRPPELKRLSEFFFVEDYDSNGNFIFRATPPHGKMTL